MALAILALMLQACATEGDPGQPCDPTPKGAGECHSGVCLNLACEGRLTKTVCAGQTCACVDHGCFDEICADDQVCVQAEDGQAYCLPTDVCVGD